MASQRLWSLGIPWVQSSVVSACCLQPPVAAPKDICLLSTTPLKIHQNFKGEFHFHMTYMETNQARSVILTYLSVLSRFLSIATMKFDPSPATMLARRDIVIKG